MQPICRLFPPLARGTQPNFVRNCEISREFWHVKSPAWLNCGSRRQRARGWARSRVRAISSRVARARRRRTDNETGTQSGGTTISGRRSEHSNGAETPYCGFARDARVGRCRAIAQGCIPDLGPETGLVSEWPTSRACPMATRPKGPTDGACDRGHLADLGDKWALPSITATFGPDLDGALDGQAHRAGCAPGWQASGARSRARDRAVIPPAKVPRDGGNVLGAALSSASAPSAISSSRAVSCSRIAWNACPSASRAGRGRCDARGRRPGSRSARQAWWSARGLSAAGTRGPEGGRARARGRP